MEVQEVDDNDTIQHKSHDPMKKQFKTMQFRTFFITFITYAIFHIARKSFGSIKGELSKEEWMESTISSQSNMYGLMDMIFMGFYACGLYISGMLGDRIDLRKFLSSGMVGVGSILIAFGMLGIADIHTFWIYLTLWGLNGAIQSCGWPSNVAIMSKWFGHNERGVVMGLWSSCASFGNICGGALVGLLYSTFEPSIAWKLVMIASGGLMVLQSIVVYCTLVPEPPYPLETDPSEGIPSKPDTSRPEGISFWKAWMIPGVISYSIAYACVKSVTYSLFFWIPYYLTASRHMDNSKANIYSVMYDIGAILGSITGGYITDRMGVRSPYVVFSLCIAGIVIHFLYGASEQMTGLLLFCTGVLMGGPEMLITTSIAADLGTHPSLTENAQALATVTGIIDGSGSIGAAFTQYLVGRIANCHTACNQLDKVCTTSCAWDSVFFLLQLALVIGIVSLSRLVAQDLREWRRTAENEQSHLPVHQDEMPGEWQGNGPDTPGNSESSNESVDPSKRIV